MPGVLVTVLRVLLWSILGQKIDYLHVSIPKSSSFVLLGGFLTAIDPILIIKEAFNILRSYDEILMRLTNGASEY